MGTHQDPGPEGRVPRVREIGIREARTRLGEMCNAAARGDVITLTLRGIPVADLVRHEPGRQASKEDTPQDN